MRYIQKTVLALALACGILFSSSLAQAEDYSATVTYTERFGPTQTVGRVAVSGQNSLLEIDMGEAGWASFLLLGGLGKAYVASHALKAYAVFDFQADSANFADLLGKLAQASMPLELPILSFREISAGSAGSELWQNEMLTVQRSKCYFEFMGTAWTVEGFLWQPERLRPFPWKIEGIRSFSEHPADYETIGPLIELTDIYFAPQSPALFEPPAGYRQMYSTVDLMFFALIPHLNLSW